MDPNSIDTLISVLTLCSIPRAEHAIRGLVQNTLKPGGQFLFYEHVDSPIPVVHMAQRILSPIWAVCFDGCALGLPSHEWIRRADDWAVGDTWGKEGESQDNMWFHKAGRFVRKAA